MAGLLAPDESVRTETVLRFLEEMQGAGCPSCTRGVCGHEAVMSLAMGFKDAPRCLSCLAGALAQDRGELRDHVFLYIDHHECFRAGWDWAGRQEGFGTVSSPGCLWASGEERKGALDAARHPASGAAGAPRTDAKWDAGQMACGDLVLELRIRLHSMRPGEVLRVTAHDPGAPEDLPAWCRLTGHTLLLWEYPEYWIRRKEG
ncbi:MAG: sulfurtransferase TusA family protein [Candidatus Methylomirabilales bacterium]